MSKDGKSIRRENKNMSKQNNGKSECSKWWATIIYTDTDIVTIDKALKNLHVPCALSPLHNRDIVNDEEVKSGLCNEITNVILKEPHYHLLCCFPNSISEKSFRYLLEHKLGNLHYKGAEMVRSEKGYGRYLIHLDNPEKAQYNRKDIMYYCGYNDMILESPRKSETEKNNDLRFFIQLIHDIGIEDMMTLYEVCMLYAPTKVDLIIRYSSQLEKFTRGQYQKSLRNERVASAYHCDKING